MNKLLKDAIADAKAVRETALANAKLALEEAFTPKINAMISHKIKEEMESEEEPTGNKEAEASMEDEAMRMKELAGLYEEGEEMEGGEEEAPKHHDEEESEESSEEEYSDEDSWDEEGDEDLAEILRELESEESEEMEAEGADHFDYQGGEMMGDEADEDMMEDVTDMEPEHGKKDMAGEPDDVDEEIDLNELIAALREGEESEEGEEEVEEPKEETMDEAKKMKMKAKKMEEELNEAYSAVKFLRAKLSEVNLLNAKLLYVNKLFRNGNLTEAQKIKIVETFDRAKTVRETKLIYSTLAESITVATKKATNLKTKVMEGFASAPSKKTNIITEGNTQVTRFQQLAGLKK